MATHILSLSYGKDSLACLGAIEKLGWPLDGIVHAEIWATDTIPADLPPMVEFKAKADKIIKKRWGIEVKHISARNPENGKKLCYQDAFYRKRERGKHVGAIYGFPMIRGSWCQGELKLRALNDYKARIKDSDPKFQYYLGIATDEEKRLSRLDNVSNRSPLAAIGWSEADCLKWCEDNDLLSPIYVKAERGGCWFCHNQALDQLRHLRKDYPDLWDLLLQWDKDSPVIFKANGQTVHDFDRRFRYEELGLVPRDRTFRWKMLDTARSDWLDSLLA